VNCYKIIVINAAFLLLSGLALDPPMQSFAIQAQAHVAFFAYVVHSGFAAVRAGVIKGSDA
jgi:hypothetical protein